MYDCMRVCVSVSVSVWITVLFAALWYCLCSGIVLQHFLWPPTWDSPQARRSLPTQVFPQLEDNLHHISPSLFFLRSSLSVCALCLIAFTFMFFYLSLILVCLVCVLHFQICSTPFSTFLPFLTLTFLPLSLNFCFSWIIIHMWRKARRVSCLGRETGTRCPKGSPSPSPSPGTDCWLAMTHTQRMFHLCTVK